MGGRDYPPDFGTPNPDDDVGGRREAEREAFRQGEDAGYRRGMDEGYDLGRVAASNQGFSDAWDGGWKACQKWFIHERRRRQHRRGGLSRGGFCGKTGAEDPGRCACLDGTMEPLEWPDPPPQETEAEAEVWAQCSPADGVEGPETEREHGVGGVSEFEDLPDWAKQALERHGITAAPERVRDAVAEVERPWDGTAEDCDQDEYCFPVRLPGTGWWCKACDKPLRLMRPRFRGDDGG